MVKIEEMDERITLEKQLEEITSLRRSSIAYSHLFCFVCTSALEICTGKHWGLISFALAGSP
jgi:hypothetical protein